MAQNVVYTRQRAEWIRRVLMEILAAINGSGQLRRREAEAVKLAVGMAALSVAVKEPFIVKAAGGTDAAGESWPPLKKETIAYGRRHPGLNQRRGRAASQGRGGRPLLTQQQDAQWRRIYGAVFNRTHDKELAARVAWARVKEAGGKTIIGEYGNTKVQILRDSGTLLNSLSPGQDNRPSGHPNQIVRFEPGAIIVGTNRKGAAAHHFGAPGRGLPQRRLWAHPSKWPTAWWEIILRAGRDALVQVFTQRIQ